MKIAHFLLEFAINLISTWNWWQAVDILSAVDREHFHTQKIVITINVQILHTETNKISLISYTWYVN